jgi:hypothetical protein
VQSNITSAKPVNCNVRATQRTAAEFGEWPA